MYNSESINHLPFAHEARKLHAVTFAGRDNRQRAVPLSGGALPAVLPRPRDHRYPRDDVQLDHEVRCRYPARSLRQHRPVGRIHHVPRSRRSNAEGSHRALARLKQSQDHRSARAEVLGLDRRLDTRLSVDVPADVDQQARVRRVGTVDSAQEVLLIRSERQSSYYVVQLHESHSRRDLNVDTRRQNPSLIAATIIIYSRRGLYTIIMHSHTLCFVYRYCHIILL